MSNSFTDLPFIIQWHASAALLALLLGPFAVWRRRRDQLHRLLGVTWIVLMLTVATTSWFIQGLQLIGPFSPIHLFSVWTYYSILVALRHVRAGRYREHGAEMQSLYLWALGVAGIFTLLPGREMHRLIFGGDTWIGLAVMVGLGASLTFAWRLKPGLQIER